MGGTQPSLYSTSDLNTQCSSVVSLWLLPHLTGVEFSVVVQVYKPSMWELSQEDDDFKVTLAN